MQWIANMKTVYKLTILILIAVISMIVIGYSGYHYLQKANEDIKTIYADRLVPVSLINENRTYVRAMNGAILALMLTNDEKKNQEYKNFIDDRTKKVGDNLAEIEKSHLDSKAKELLDKVKVSRQKYRDARTPVIELALQNKNAEAYAIYTNSVEQLANEFVDNLTALSEYYTKLSKQMHEDSQEAFVKAKWITVGIILGVLFVLIISGWLIAKTITTPLKVMVQVCEEFADGDFRDKPRRMIRKDEIGQLADALAKMRDNVRVLMKRINESAEQVAASSEELTASSEQSAQAANQVAISITSVAAGASAQLNAAHETSAVVEQMSASIEQVAANTNQVAVQSAQAAEKAKDGGKAVDKAVVQMTHIENTVNASAQVVAKLGERSMEIGQIVDTISSIAGQTNLLALNAAIEAARAGEQGRGFAVVAEEVRKLAEQSQEAAKKIAELIGAIQGDTNQAVIAMNDGTREVKTGAEVVNAAGAAFREITELVALVSDQVKEISATTQKMAGGSQQIVGSVKRIDEISETSASESQSVSAATEEQLASMEEIASSSEALAELAQDLQAAVSKFRI